MSYKKGEIQKMTPELWQAKKVVDSTIHPGIFSTSSSQAHRTLPKNHDGI